MVSFITELKAKAPKDLSPLVDSLGFMIKVMLELYKIGTNLQAEISA